MPSVIINKVRSPQEKIIWLSDLVQKWFARQKTLTIFVDRLEVAQFVDNLLWKIPKESFIPHGMGESKASERVMITWARKNLNQALIGINLSNQALEDPSFEKIYEMEDLTRADHADVVGDKRKLYEQQGWEILLH